MQHELRKIVIIGLGYIGLPTASMLSALGDRFVGVYINDNVLI